MNATLPATSLPSEETNYSTGVMARLVNAYRENPFQFNVGGTLYDIGKRHLAMLKGIAKVRGEIAALPATLATAPSVFKLQTLTAADEATRRIEREFAELKTEVAREAYIKTIATGITKPAPAPAPTPQAKAPALRPTTTPTAAPAKPTAPALSLDEQFAALATAEAKSAFLKQHGATALKRR